MRSSAVIKILALATLALACANAFASCTEGTEFGQQLTELPFAELSARDQKDPIVQNELGRRYGLGEGVARDSAVSFSWYQRAAEQGLCTAQTNLAFMYVKGEGIEKDFAAAERWYTKAAEQGDARAQHGLGFMYLAVDGHPKDGAIAEKWMLEAANQGFVPAQEVLKTMYELGDGVPRDLEKATLWLHRVRDAEIYGRVWKEQPSQ